MGCAERSTVRRVRLIGPINLWLVRFGQGRHGIVLRPDTCTRRANRFPKEAAILNGLSQAVPIADCEPLRFAGLPSHFAVVSLAEPLPDLDQLGCFLQPAQQRGGMNAQDTGGMGFILAGGVQNFVDIAVFQLTQADKLIAGGRKVEGG